MNWTMPVPVCPGKVDKKPDIITKRKKKKEKEKKKDDEEFKRKEANK